MKIIASIAGIAGVNVASEYVLPAKGVPPHDLANYIAQAYEFSVTPLAAMAQGQANLPFLHFQNGIFIDEGHRVPIAQLISMLDGDLIWAQNTDIADKILGDYLDKLDTDLGYRFKDIDAPRFYNSSLLVQFDDDAIDKMNKSALGQGITKFNPSIPRPYLFKRISFGTDASNAPPGAPSVLQFVPSDFIIERRANELMSSNRFFCTAPVSMNRHAEILQEFEEGLR